MQSLKTILKIFGWVCLIGIWLWFFVTQVPILLTAGTGSALLAFAFLALSAIVGGNIAWSYIKGSSKKETTQ